MDFVVQYGAEDQGIALRKQKNRIMQETTKDNIIKNMRYTYNGIE